jgi:hypothetical protein
MSAARETSRDRQQGEQLAVCGEERLAVECHEWPQFVRSAPTERGPGLAGASGPPLLPGRVVCGGEAFQQYDLAVTIADGSALGDARLKRCDGVAVPAARQMCIADVVQRDGSCHSVSSQFGGGKGITE